VSGIALVGLLLARATGADRARVSQQKLMLCLAKIPSAFIFIAFQLPRVGGIQPALNR
jgi:hypothetical protein